MKTSLTTAAATLCGFLCVWPHDDVATRVTQLEKRVAALETAMQPAASARKEAPPAPRAAELLVPVTISDKRYCPADPASGTRADSLSWNARYDFAKLGKPARAIRGVIEFSDLFGQVRLRVRSTIDATVPAGTGFDEKGTGIAFDPLLHAHVWLRDTDPKDLRVRFRVSHVVYGDGTQAEF